MRFVGTVSEPATVTVQGVPAIVTSQNQFAVETPVTSGTSVATLSATDPSGNKVTQQYEVDSTTEERTFTYDANGNLTTDDTRTFEWDGRNQLVAVTTGTRRTEFAYDGLQQRVRVTQKEGGVTENDTRMLWCESEICEERASDGSAVLRRVFRHSEQVAGAPRFVERDHLGSVTELTDVTGAVMSRYAYDPWGRRTLVEGTESTSVGYTGHQLYADGAVLLAQYRAYDADLGRWLNEDPLRLLDGPNMFAYVFNNPVAYVDIAGLQGIGARAASAALRERAVTRACAEGALQRFRAQPDFTNSQPRYNHCMMSCRIAQQCGGGPRSFLAGLAKEYEDVRDCLKSRKQRSCDTAGQPSDITDNWRGLTCPAGTPCEKRCGGLSNSGDGPPGPLGRLGLR